MEVIYLKSYSTSKRRCSFPVIIVCIVLFSRACDAFTIHSDSKQGIDDTKRPGDVISGLSRSIYRYLLRSGSTAVKHQADDFDDEYFVPRDSKAAKEDKETGESTSIDMQLQCCCRV